MNPETIIERMQSSRSAVRCLIADGHPAMLRAVGSVLVEAGFDLVGELSSPAELLDWIRSSRPNVVVVDAAMLGVSGQALGQACAETRVVIFTGSDGEAVLRDGVEPGAQAYVSKSQKLEVLVEVVDTVAAGGSWVDPTLAPTLVSKGAKGAEALTPRERDVLVLVADGSSYQEISKELSIAVSTVQQHVASAVGHLEAHNRTQAVAVALRLFLID